MTSSSDRDASRAEGEEMIRDGDLVIEERMSRRDGLVEYEGTVEATETAEADDTVLDDAMQAGAAVLGGTGATAMVDDAASMAGGTTGTAAGRGAPSPADPLSMSTDNTAEGRLTADTVEGGPIALVQEGMKVVDAAGDEIGKVEFVKMGDPMAVTTQGEEMRSGDVFGHAIEDLFGGGANLPEAIGNELVRIGFIRIDGKGWFGRDCFAGADQIAGVAGDTVRLAVAKDALPTA